MKKVKLPASTVRRKKPEGSLSESDCFSIIRDYMETPLTNKQLAEKYCTTEKNIELIVSRHWKALTNVRETKNLIGDQMNNLNHKGGNYMALKAIQKVPSINQDFLNLLSAPDDPLLTDNEIQYALVYAATGDNHQALHESGLNIGLMGAKSDRQKHQYQLSCRLRGIFLRQKTNVAQYILKLKESHFLPDVIDSEFVKRELLEQLHQLKELNDSPQTRREIGKTLEMIGKTVGAFSDVVKIQEVDPSKALDYLESLGRADAQLITNEE